MAQTPQRGTAAPASSGTPVFSSPAKPDAAGDGKRGAFILFEGLDRSGKSSQCKMLVEALQQQGTPVEAMVFPDRTTPIGKIISSYLASATEMDDHALHLLFSSNRWEAEQKIRRLLEGGTTIVCDRYAFSGIAYTGAKGLDLDWCAAPDAGLPAPDLVLYLEVPVEVAEQRGEYGEERYEKREFQAKVRASFEGLKERFPGWEVVDGQPEPAEVHEKVVGLAQAAIDSTADKPIAQLDFGGARV